MLDSSVKNPKRDFRVYGRIPILLTPRSRLSITLDLSCPSVFRDLEVRARLN
jgi:hypothetical protein